MGFLKKIKFWKKRDNTTPTKEDASVSTEDPRTCDAATVSMDPTVMCATYTQTETRIDSGDCGGTVKDESQRQLEIKNKKIRELEEELAVSKSLTENVMLNMKSVEQQIRKYAEEPVISWSGDCECKLKVSSVADFFKTFIITERDANKPEATSSRNNGVDCETQTEPNARRRDCTNADNQEIVRRLEERNRKLSAIEKYESEIALLNEELERVSRDRTSYLQHINKRNEEEKGVLLRKISDMRNEIISLKEARTPPTDGHTKEHQQKKRRDHTGSKEAQWPAVVAGTRKIRSHTRHSESKPIPGIHNRYGELSVTLVNTRTEKQWERRVTKS